MKKIQMTQKMKKMTKKKKRQK